MATLLAENPQASGDQQADGEITPAVAPEPPGGSATGTENGPACAKCAAPMVPGQDWCLQCGAGAPNGAGSSGWSSLATVAVITAVLVLGAGAAAYAALSKKQPKAALVTKTVAQATTPPVATTPVTPGIPTPTTSTPTVPGISQPPKIPLQAPTPTSTSSTPQVSTSTPTAKEKEEKAAAKKNSGEGNTGGSSTEKGPEPLLLDTNAASTYNPYSYPATNFGDPSLTIDGDTSTGWTAQLIPASAPNLAEGVLIDLHTPQKVASFKLVTTTPGMTVQVFGANGQTVPSSITAPEWTTLSRSIVVKKRHSHFGLRNKKKAYRFITLWISRAPASAVGTPEAPGRVSVNELELFPPATS